MRVFSVRGAVKLNKDKKEEVNYWTSEVVNGLLLLNEIKEDNIVNIIFSQTKDICSENPARALRSTGYFGKTPLFCTSEPDYPDTLPNMIRVLLTYLAPESHEPKAVYKNGAENLRRDLVFP